ncbi:MAG: hypothetical protein WD689_01995 [Gaiellaceae bacterium]
MGWLWLVLLIILIANSAGNTDRPVALAGGWLIAVGAMVLWWALTPPRSPRVVPWSGLLLLAGLGCVAAYLAREGRALEIALWIPVLLAALLGWVFFLGAFYADGPTGRIAGGILAGVFWAAPLALWATVGDFTGLGF